MKMFHRHKYGKIEDGYQYCVKCGIAIVAPCKHNWEKLYETTYNIETFGGKWRSGTLLVYECSECKEIRKEFI